MPDFEIRLGNVIDADIDFYRESRQDYENTQFPEQIDLFEDEI